MVGQTNREFFRCAGLPQTRSLVVSREEKPSEEDAVGPVDLYLLPAELDYRREELRGSRYRKPRRRLVARRAAQPPARRTG